MSIFLPYTYFYLPPSFLTLCFSLRIKNSFIFAADIQYYLLITASKYNTQTTNSQLVVRSTGG